MANESSTIVQRLWNYCNILRDDGMSYGDYVEQLTYLLFLKMDDENVQVLGKPSVIPLRPCIALREALVRDPERTRT